MKKNYILLGLFFITQIANTAGDLGTKKIVSIFTGFTYPQCTPNSINSNGSNTGVFTCQ